MKKYKWGILGTGFVARSFADGLGVVQEAEKTAVCGTGMQKANKFADEFGIEQRYDNFDEFLEKSGVDIVYVAVPNSLHYDFVMRALDAGKNVLCEKPMADNAGQTKAMMEKAKEKNLFLMEGLWTRCFPATIKAREWMDEGRIGELRSVRASFGIKAAEGWQGWKAAAEFAGGAIRDVGIYTISMAFLGFKQAPEEIVSSHYLKYGADYHSELLFKYSNNRTAYLTNSFDMVTDYNTVFYGSKGLIMLGRVWCPNYAELFTFEEGDEFTKTSVELFNDDHPSSGMQYEIRHVHECLDAGKKESFLFPLSESLQICGLIDGLRKEWGVVYPSEA